MASSSRASKRNRDGDEFASESKKLFPSHVDRESLMGFVGACHSRCANAFLRITPDMVDDPQALRVCIITAFVYDAPLVLARLLGQHWTFEVVNELLRYWNAYSSEQVLKCLKTAVAHALEDLRENDVPRHKVWELVQHHKDTDPYKTLAAALTIDGTPAEALTIEIQLAFNGPTHSWMYMLHDRSSTILID